MFQPFKKVAKVKNSNADAPRCHYLLQHHFRQQLFAIHVFRGLQYTSACVYLLKCITGHSVVHMR